MCDVLYVYLVSSRLPVMFVSNSCPDLPGIWTIEGSPSNITTGPVDHFLPQTLLFTILRHPCTVALLELTCPLDSEHHLQATRSRKQGKVKYLQLLTEFDCLQITFMKQ